MSEIAPNLFNALFEFHPRDGHTPEENFLTEGFAYVLKSSKSVCDAWLSRVLDRPIETSRVDIFTRNTERDQGTVVYPDMLIEAKLSDGTSAIIYSEHKWRAGCDSNQLHRYLRVAQKRGINARVVFVGLSPLQRVAAVKSGLADRSCLLWQDVFRILEGIPDKTEILSQFLEFMKTHGLNPGERLTLEKMQAYLQSNDFEVSLLGAANKLMVDQDWSIVPARYSLPKQVTNRYGRIAIEFATPGWKPTITAGFLIDTRGHGVVFTNPGKGIDLLLRIETMPLFLRSAEPALAALRMKVPDLKKGAASVLLVGERGNGNGHSMLLVRSCLWDVIEGARTEAEQLDLIYNRLNSWLTTLFADGELECAFKAAGLDGGF